MVKRWDYQVGNDGFGEPGVNECYITDIEEITRMGFILVFQRIGDKVQLVRLPEEQEHAAGLVGLDGFDDYNDECYNCYWNEGDPFDKKLDEILYHEWGDIQIGPVLIWWDHDLGDVVIDNFDPEEDEVLGVAPASDCNYQKVCHNVYFYWIT